MQAFGRLLDVMDRLREECPWDRKQTNDSLRANTIEETYELCEALIRDDQREICKELGDVLLHIVFYGRIGEEKGQSAGSIHLFSNITDTYRLWATTSDLIVLTSVPNPISATGLSANATPAATQATAIISLFISFSCFVFG